MQYIEDFYHKKENISYTMYSHLAWFAIELWSVFAGSQLFKIFLYKIDKKFLDLATPRIIFNYDNKATLVQVFVKVKKCHKILCKHDTTNLVAWMMDVSKLKKVVTTTSSLIETQLKKTMYFWKCGEFGHIKNDFNCLKKKKILYIEKS